MRDLREAARRVLEVWDTGPPDGDDCDCDDCEGPLNMWKDIRKEWRES